ncbi:MAG TPA: DNA mismatch repair protein MutS [Alphaproteobacteria bacterium]|nr:DNA mismatch repair protein MutS [Alphaproteobacteria bacterium]
MAVADSPVMLQYKRICAANPGCIVMFRMGDFYEIFENDAVVASEILGITLTRRRTGKEGDEGIPMCGVPFHAAEAYVGKLVAAGHKVALVEQTETPEEAKKARGSGALVNREVVRIYTAGTLTEENLLTATSANYLMAAAKDGPMVGVAWLEMSTGEVGVRAVREGDVGGVASALNPGEVVVPEALSPLLEGVVGRRQVSVQESLFDPKRAVEAIKRAYGVTSVEGLNVSEGPGRTALGALLAYAELTQLGKLPALRAPGQVEARAVLRIDPATRRSLELTESMLGMRRDSLLGVMDKTVTAAGARLLARWIAEPLADVGRILGRQGCVTALLGNSRTAIRQHLKETGDVARCMSRLLLGRGGPRDLAVLRATGQQLPGLVALLSALGDAGLAGWGKKLSGLEKMTARLVAALVEEPGALVRDGGFIADGFDGELDGYRKLVNDGNTLLQQLEESETAGTGIPLKLRYNKVWGYYFELTKQHEGKVPAHFMHRQTTVGTHRYTTQNLLALERDLGSAGANAQAREAVLFEELVNEVKAASVPLLDVAEALATVDVLAGLAEIASGGGWVCPVVEDSNALHIERGRHPVVAARVSDFVPNDCDLSDGQLWLITGPNMAGKSTFLRQVALLVILAQVGSYVPATAMRIGVADKLFSRIGAADNLAAGQSTFMVEMVETAAILNGATNRSLVILDELGRGTATYDGLAIAWACVEDLATRGSRTLFATHYHELTGLCPTLPHVKPYQAAVKEWNGEMVFLHEIRPGAAGGSFGVQVAKLAGVPAPVVKRADIILQGLLKSARQDGVAKVGDLSLFAHATTPAAKDELRLRLQGIDVDGISPREALDELARLREMIG